ncbi:MAG: ABC transporter permease subunit [Actinomycetes bacterium]
MTAAALSPGADSSDRADSSHTDTPAGGASGPRLARLVGTEVLKIRTTRTWWAMLLGLVAVVAVFAGIGAAFAGSQVPGQPPIPGPEDPAVARTYYTSGFSWAYVFALVLGILAIAGEYRHQTVTPTFLATPRRGLVVVAKMVATALFSLLYGVVALGVSTALTAVIFAARGYDVDLMASGLPRAFALAVLATAVWSLVGLGLGTLIRNQVAALLVGVGIAFIVDPFVSFLLNNVSWGGDVARFFPSQASSAIVEASSGGFDVSYLSWWAGALVLLGYGVVFAGVGTALTLRRDVT